MDAKQLALMGVVLLVASLCVGVPLEYRIAVWVVGLVLVATGAWRSIP